MGGHESTVVIPTCVVMLPRGSVTQASPADGAARALFVSPSLPNWTGNFVTPATCSGAPSLSSVRGSYSVQRIRWVKGNHVELLHSGKVREVYADGDDILL